MGDLPYRPMPRLAPCRAADGGASSSKKAWDSVPADANRDQSEASNEELVLLLFQLELDTQLNRALSYEAFEVAQEIRRRRDQARARLPVHPVPRTPGHDPSTLCRWTRLPGRYRRARGSGPAARTSHSYRLWTLQPRVSGCGATCSGRWRRRGTRTPPRSATS